MSNSSEISSLQSEIARLRSQKRKCEDAIAKAAGMIGFIEVGSKELIGAREYLRVEYEGKRAKNLVGNLDNFEEISNDIKESAQAYFNDLKKLKESIEGKIRRKQSALEKLKAEASEG